MKIKHYLYNAFTIEDGETKIAIDPGKNLGLFNLKSLIPETEWPGITHLIVTHNDPDHFDYAVPLAKKSNAAVLCGEALVEDFTSQEVKKVHAIDINKKIKCDNISFEGLKVKHGQLYFKLAAGLIEMKNIIRSSNRGGEEVFLGPFRIKKSEHELTVYNHGTVKLLFGLIRAERDNIDWARGTMGYKISIGSKTVVNLGDSIFKSEWENLKPDVLMIPIGGLGNNTWTMDVHEALKAVEIISPKLVIPCHYSVPFLWKKKMCPADDLFFKSEVEKMGIECSIMKYGDEIEI
ncbi:MAG: metal-dependent hydrolase [bacterium]|nr:metal-dependent hydrolase [bacterium]